MAWHSLSGGLGDSRYVHVVGLTASLATISGQTICELLAKEFEMWQMRRY